MDVCLWSIRTTASCCSTMRREGCRSTLFAERAPADCQSATRQTTSLRYDAVRPTAEFGINRIQAVKVGQDKRKGAENAEGRRDFLFPSGHRTISSANYFSPLRFSAFSASRRLSGLFQLPGFGLKLGRRDAGPTLRRLHRRRRTACLTCLARGNPTHKSSSKDSIKPHAPG